MITLIMHILNGTAIVATAVVFGTDVFFALVGKKAAAKSKDASIADVMGHLHEVADARMPVIGATATFSTLLQVIIFGFANIQGQLAAFSLMALLAHLTVYLRVARPINNVMTEGVKFGRMVNNIRELQQRWDRVIGLRAALLFIAITGLIMITCC
ncbi:hypothetical protein SNE26_06775 [Mucilaginibacter sp. cycad4]|uniref:hypothetical protein n=1 Tax=Mucilaginibacter sp. cycad4 TaxID=3342096 RepID=UPI002AAC4083|nr:hypothetical protein [Mucilaginibacter gossypii]WPV01473.1 hypothetical protein SNE26_06775 [Mucilaginibacter gossypii]